MQGRTRRFALVAGIIGALALAIPVGAITNGQPDDEEHPYVGQLFLYDADYVDSRLRRSRRLVQLLRHAHRRQHRAHGRPLHLWDRQGRRVHPA